VTARARCPDMAPALACPTASIWTRGITPSLPSPPA
jgi:hypothetical protein